MPTVLHWLARHPVVHLLVCIVYFSVVVLPHEWMGKWIYATFFPGDIDQYNFRFLTATLLASLLFFVPLFLNLKKYRSGRRITIGYLVFTIALMVAAYFTIFVLATELVHFPQYALMAILLFPFSWRYGATLFWTTLLGVLDEGYQYFYLAPDRTDYFDFNDVVINFLGAALGLVFVRAFSKRLPAPAPRPWKQSPVLWTSAALLVFASAAIFSGKLAVYPHELSAEGAWLLVKEVPENFWSDFHHIRYHVVLPEEGVGILMLLFAIYAGLGRNTQKMLPPG
jgi:VanZ family protein